MKRKNRLKILSIVIAIYMAICMVPFQSISAADVTQPDNATVMTNVVPLGSSAADTTNITTPSDSAADTTNIATLDNKANTDSLTINNEVGVAPSDDEKPICKENVTVNEDFAPDSVLVTLKQSDSRVNKAITRSMFDGVGIAITKDAIGVAKDKNSTVTSSTYKDSTLNSASIDNAKVENSAITSNEDNNMLNDASIGITAVEDLTAMPNADASLENKNGASVNFHQILKLTLQKEGKSNVVETIHRLEQLDCVLLAGPNYHYHTCDTVAATNDPLLSSQWALENINAIGAWAKYNPNVTSVKVGIIDSGISPHDDLNLNVGAGYDFYTKNYPYVTNDDIYDHGTRVAGIVGAVGNNGIGISGVAQRVTLIPLQVSDTRDGNSLDSDSIVKAVTYAKDQNIPIINASFGNPSFDSNLYYAIMQYPGLMVCAAGNSHSYYPDYPAGYHMPNTISVASIDANNLLSIFSNYGGSVDIAAPGENVLTTASLYLYDYVPYAYDSGTSFAAPYVTGAAALLKGNFPTATTAQIKEAIISSETYTPSLTQWLISGRLNVEGALDYLAALKAPELALQVQNLQLQNPFVNYGAPYGTAGYYKDSSEVIHLSGLIKSTIPLSGGMTVIGSLPAGYRPANPLIFTAKNGSGYARIDVGTDGAISTWPNDSTGYYQNYLSLDGISFATNNTVQTLPLQNQFVNYGAPYGSFGYYQDGLGIVHLSGLVKSIIPIDTTVGGASYKVIGSLPAACRPVNSNTRIFIAKNSGGYARIDVCGNGSIAIYQGDGTGNFQDYLSLDGISFATTSTPSTLQALKLQSCFTNFGALYESAEYYKDIRGTVHLSGLIKSTTPLTTGTWMIGTLPTGYLPTNNPIFIVKSGGGYARINISKDGLIIVEPLDGTGDCQNYLSLDGISFTTN